MHPLEYEIQSITNAFNLNQINEEERDYLLKEIRDVKAAQECAGNEEMFRYIVHTCNMAMGII